MINSEDDKEKIFNKYHDRMTETYKLFSNINNYQETNYDISYLNQKYRLSFDEADKDFINTNLYKWFTTNKA